MLTSACARVLSSPSRVASSSARSPQRERLLGVLGEHRELGEAAVGAGELDRLAERLEDRDRLERLRARGVAVAGEPVEARQDPRAAADGRLVAELSRRSRSRARSPGRRPRAGRRRTRRSPAPRARPPARARGSRSTKSRRAPVVRVRLAVRLQRRRSPRGDERVLGDDVLRARGLRVVDDVGRIGVRGQQRLEDLGVQAAPRGDRDARPDRVPRQLVPEANVARVDLEQLPALRLLRRRGPVRASPRPAPTCRRGSARPRRARRGAARASSSRDARPSTAFATDGGSSAAAGEASSSVT